MTLGCGAVGGSSTSNNIGPMDLINIKRVAYGTKEIEELRTGVPGQESHCCEPSQYMIDEIVKKIMKELI